MNYPKISIVTPSFNHAEFLEDCILSIISQSFPNLEYIIIDGGSTDGSIDIIKKYESHLKYWVSEKDNGLYDALNKGFKQSTGEIMGWLNSDDILHRKSLFTIAEIFTKFDEINWIQGYPTVIDSTGRIVYHRNARNGKYDFYLKKYHDGVFIQQESTYWRQSLWGKSGKYISTEYRYAGDFELWTRFFSYESLTITNALIGAFRIRGKGQFSSDNFPAYLRECDTIIDNAIENLHGDELAELERLKRLKKSNDKPSLFTRIINKLSKQIPEKSGKYVYYDFTEMTFKLTEL
jgi:glycosyltransferase involved in cell wall biosynthesis